MAMEGIYVFDALLNALCSMRFAPCALLNALCSTRSAQREEESKSEWVGGGGRCELWHSHVHLVKTHVPGAGLDQSDRKNA